MISVTSRPLRATGNLRVVQGILGHSDIAITAKFYTDALVDDMRAAMEKTAAAKSAAAALDPQKANEIKD
jgi:site-specific recombinase XerD